MDLLSSTHRTHIFESILNRIINEIKQCNVIAHGRDFTLLNIFFYSYHYMSRTHVSKRTS